MANRSGVSPCAGQCLGLCGRILVSLCWSAFGHLRRVLEPVSVCVGCAVVELVVLGPVHS